MAYARWSSVAELKESLTKVEKEVKKSGIPMYYDENDVYINDKGIHNLVIGITGSGKSQTTILPELKYAIDANESFLVNDPRGDIKETLKPLLDKNKYDVITIDFTNPSKGNKFNPLLLPYQLYKNDKDTGLELIEQISHYIFASEGKTNVDPFWENSASSLFTGLLLYMFETLKEKDINLTTLYELSLDLDKIKKDLEKFSKTSSLFINLNSVLASPEATKSSIVSVFMQNIRLYVEKESLVDMMKTTDFSFENIKESKKAIFIIGDNKRTTSRLVPIVIQEFYTALMTEKTDKNFNIVIDEFENLYPIRDLHNKLTEGRANYIRFTVVIKSILELRNNYGKEEAEVLRMSFGNIIYLLSNDNDTLEEISKLCGEQMTEAGLIPLVTKEDLKLMQNYEAVILMPRMYPIKTKLLPFFAIK